MSAAVREVLRRPITDRSAWKGRDLAASTEWIYTLTPTAVAEIDAMLARLRAQPVPLTGCSITASYIRRQNVKPMRPSGMPHSAEGSLRELPPPPRKPNRCASA